jgi:hypothetical protein
MDAGNLEPIPFNSLRLAPSQRRALIAPLMGGENAGVLVCNWLGLSPQKPVIMSVFAKPYYAAHFSRPAAATAG